jgi:hypothetical protein
MRNVRSNQLKNREKKLGTVPVFLTLGIFLCGCNATRESICNEFPNSAGEVASVRTEIAALRGRKPASANPATDTESALDRKAWMSWGEKALKRAQWAKDTLENDSHGRKAIAPLNDVGLALVSFHGYVEQGKWKKADAELDQVETGLKLARKLACDAEAPTRSSPKSKKAKKP